MLDGKVQYRIPLFQRTYSWGETQWARLRDDILGIYGADEPRTHFVGSVVTQRMPGAAGGVVKYSVIDGQQRMTTLMILLCAIRDRARRESDRWGNLPDEIQKSYLINEFADVPDEKNKLAPTLRDAAPFRAMVDDAPSEINEVVPTASAAAPLRAMIDDVVPSGETRIGAARRYFSDALGKGDANGAPLDLRKLVNCIVSRLDMVSITLDGNDNPNRIFESLNYTGLTLDAADLIRNYMFMNIRDVDKQNAAYEQHWHPMQESLDWRQELFFWRYLMVDGSLPKQERDAIFNGIKREVGNAPDDNSIIGALERFRDFSNYYLQVVNPNPNRRGENEEVSTQINRLNQWGLDISHSFLMKALNYVESGNIESSELADVARMLESFVVRRYALGHNQMGLRILFAGMSANVDFENKFVESSRECLMNWRRASPSDSDAQGVLDIDLGPDTYSDYLARNANWRWGWPDDDSFVKGLVNLRLYVPNRRRTRLVLDALERELSGKEVADLSSKDITIEHIMPQKLTTEWRDALGPDADEIHGRWIDTLGNLTLTGYNSELGNMPFSDKKAKLAESKFSLSASLKDLDEWNAETIEQRGRELAELAAKLWPR